MSAATEKDYRAIFEAAGALYECQDLETLQRIACEQIGQLVRAEWVTFNYFAPTIPEVSVAGWPGSKTDQQERDKVFARHLAEHPVLRYYLSTGDPSAHKLSDFLTVEQYHALELYQQLYRELRCEDQFVFMLFAPGSEWVSLALSRSQRDFTERDRDVLNLFRPLLAKAHQFMDRLGRLDRGMSVARTGSLRTRVTSVVLDEEDRPVRFWSESKSWFSRFFHGRRLTTSGLPDSVSVWLRRSRRASSLDQHGGPRTLSREHRGQSLRLQVLHGLGNMERILVLGLQTIAGPLDGAGAKILTRREVQILQEVERGKSNDEVSVALGISALTVRKHLENIFHKLHVPNRTAAVTRFRQVCAEVAAGFYAVLSLLDDAIEVLDAFMV